MYSWDITKLPGPVKRTYFDAYVMDIVFLYIVGAHAQTHEPGLLATEMMTEIFAVQGIPNVVHADRGTSMTSKTVATLLADREVTRSHSPPRCRTTIHILQSLVKTLKYGPMWPERFASIDHVRNILDAFTSWYNDEHRDTGIGLHAPADVHFGLAEQKDQTRPRAHSGTCAAS